MLRWIVGDRVGLLSMGSIEDEQGGDTIAWSMPSDGTQRSYMFHGCESFVVRCLRIAWNTVS